jgi:hypothetical protein
VQTVLEVGKVRKRLTAEKRLKDQLTGSSVAEHRAEVLPEITHGMAGADGEQLDHRAAVRGAAHPGGISGQEGETGGAGQG